LEDARVREEYFSSLLAADNNPPLPAKDKSLQGILLQQARELTIPYYGAPKSP
jgi:hypothetical protein